MSHTKRRDSLPLPQPIRHRVRARQDFEDTVTADRLETLAHPGLAMAARAMAPRSRIEVPPVDAEVKAALAWSEQPAPTVGWREGDRDRRVATATPTRSGSDRSAYLSMRNLGMGIGIAAFAAAAVAAWSAAISYPGFF